MAAASADFGHVMALALFALTAIGVLFLAMRGRPQVVAASPYSHVFDVVLSLALFAALV